MRTFKRFNRNIIKFLSGILFLFMAVSLPAQDIGGQAFYDALKKFELRGKASVSNLTLRRDRAEMTFTGDFYFAAPVNGKVAGAVFVGNGTFKADAPPISYEKEAIQRFLNSESAESDFKTAVLRFSDDTMNVIGKEMDANATVLPKAQRLASELEPRLLYETGANISARLLISLANQESPGVFLAQFDEGKLGRFTFLVDMQARIPGSAFSINGGEKVFLFSYSGKISDNDIWLASYSETDLSKGSVNYSDEFDLVSPEHYRMEIDTREFRKTLRTKIHIDIVSLTDNLLAVPMLINEGLTEFINIRLNKAMRVKTAQCEGKDIPFIQEDWESGLTVILPKAVKKGEKFSLDLAFEGNFSADELDFVLKGAPARDKDTFRNASYLKDNISWYPRYGHLKRSTYHLLFRHNRRDKIVSIGRRIREGTWPGSKDALTEYVMDTPVTAASFAVGVFDRFTKKRKLESGDIDLEFYDFSKNNISSNDWAKSVAEEMGNALAYFTKYFGSYPYESLRGVAQPYQFGQALPTMLMIPFRGGDRMAVFIAELIGHETSHQWWGHSVAWRSHRDLWLSEGFAEYSGMLYESVRRSSTSRMWVNARDALISLSLPPFGDQGIGEGKIAEIGPLILGHRLRTRNTLNAYDSLIYNKGALVLRMLHYLFTDPETNSGQPFFDMMSDFVRQYRNKTAATEDFIRVASEHFANTAIGKQFGLKDLDWFFQQWVYESKLPKYRMEYQIESGDNGQAVLKGTIFQENAGPKWFMPLPVVCRFGDQAGRVTIFANGQQTDFKIPLPMKPSSVALDPEWWILSDKIPISIKNE